jgi:hypothetical protein
MIPCVRRFGLSLLTALVLSGSPAARADYIVAPNAFENVSGGSNNGFPFNLSPFRDSMRYQQIFHVDQFKALTGPEWVTQIAFRVASDGQGNAFSSTLPSIQIDLSTSSKNPAALSAHFADNVGANNTMVFNGALSLSSQGDPKVFDVVIDLTTPFLYDPAQGDLLMDIHNFKGGATTQFDAVVVQDGSSRRAWSNDADGVDFTGPDNVIVDSFVLVTRFTFSPASVAPEPATLTLAALGAAGLTGLAWRRRRSA